jgi:hypothetical protein
MRPFHYARIDGVPAALRAYGSNMPSNGSNAA